MTHEPINTALPASREPVVSPHQSASPRTPPATRLGAVARFVVCAWLAALPTLTLDFAVAQEPSVAEPSPVAPEPPGSAEKPSEATEAKTEGSAAQSEVSVEGATKKAGPAPVTSSRELLELFGVEASYYEHLVDDQEVDVAENEALLRTLLGINRFTAMQTFQWTKPAGSLPAMIDDPAPHRGEIVAIRGRAAQITRLEPLPEVQRIFGIPEFFRVELEATDPGAGWATAVVYTLKIPAAWRAAPTPPFGEYRTSFTGFFFKRAGAGRPVFTTTRMAWHPPGFLGDLGMDLSRFDEVQQHTRVLPREPFYELLAAMGRASKDHLKRLTASDIKSPKFDRDHIRDWFVFPWKIRAAAELGTPSPGKRLYDLLPPHVQAAVRTARPDAMPSPELMQGLIDALNAATANPALYDPASFREVFLDQPLLTPVELALLRNDRPAALAFQKAKMSHIDAVKRDVRGRRKEKPPVSRPAAYDALIQQGLRLLAPDELIRWNRTLLESAFPNEIGATHPLSVVPLFLTPETQEGRLVRLEGVCRRALKIQVTDQEIVSRLGLKEYFEMWLFTEDSQEFPIVCIVHRLPRGIPEGDDICEMVRVRGVFLKTWTFESSRTLQRKAQLAQLSLQKGERKQAGELVGGQPPSPVVIGLDAEWMRSAAVANPIGELIRAAVLGFLVLFVVGVWTAINWNRKSDTLLEARLQRARTPDGMTLNLSDVPVLAEPDFRNYGREESTAASSGDQNGAREPHDSSSASASAQEPAGARPGE